MAETRPVRYCMSCGGVDDHPRHVHAVGQGDGPTTPELAKKALAAAGDNNEAILEQIMDTASVVKHMDCCRADGCPDGSCDKLGALGAEGLTGPKLLAFLTEQVDHDKLTREREKAAIARNKAQGDEAYQEASA